MKIEDKKVGKKFKTRLVNLKTKLVISYSKDHTC